MMKEKHYGSLNTLKNYRFVTNRLGETDETLPSDVEEWYAEISDSESGYLIVVDGIYGFLFVGEESHMGQPETSEGYIYSKKHVSRTEDAVFELLEEIATETCNEMKPYDIYLSKSYGFDSCHEFGIFFPVGSDVKDIPKKIEIYNKAYLQLEKKKWRSFYDLIEFGE